MAEVQIRRYEDDDDEAVKEIFTLGMSEHVPSSFIHLLKQPLAQAVLVCVFCGLLASSHSFLLPVLAVTLLLAAGRQLITYMFTSYIDTSLNLDLNHIRFWISTMELLLRQLHSADPKSVHKARTTYLTQPNTFFWVAESDNRVVAMVACLPAERHADCLELKRMSVQRSHRGRGIAKALCHTVAEFGRERGFQAVILYTSVVQTDAQKLYEHVGYRRVREFVVPELVAKITNFTIMEYRLDLQPTG